MKVSINSEKLMSNSRFNINIVLVMLLLLMTACQFSSNETTPPSSGNLEGVVPPKGDNPSAQSNPAISTTTSKSEEAKVRALAKLKTLTLRQKLGQLFMVGFTDRQDAEDLLKNYSVGSLVLMSRNDASPIAVKQNLDYLQALANRTNGVGLLVSVDQEGGPVQRLKTGFPILPSARQAANSRDIASYAKSLGDSLLAAGVNMNLAPVLDIDYGQASVVGSRAFGSTPSSVDAATSQYLAGSNSSGIISTLKHYPGHGSASADSHQELPIVEKSLAELTDQDLAPFAQNIRRGNVEAVMVGSIAFPQIDSSRLPATLSKVMVQDILRNQLGYNGLVLTDDVGMGALKLTYTDQQIVTLALNASIDIVLCVRQDEATSCNQRQFVAMFNHLENAVRTGVVTPETIDNAVLRVLVLKAHHGLL